MKRLRLFLLLLCAVAINASAQIPTDGTITLDSTTVDSNFYWFTQFRDKPFSLDIDYTNVDSLFQFAVVVSNFDNGSWSYYSFPGVSFPVTYDPNTQAYHDANGVRHATDIYKGSSITFKRFGILIIKERYRLGPIGYRLKQ